jgi:hypothetical protein
MGFFFGGWIMDVNEKIVYAWLASKDYFIIDGIDFGQFHSDIDILAVNLKAKEIIDFEIKIRTGSTKISDNTTKQNGFTHYVNQLLHNDRATRINSIVGTSHGYALRKVFVTTYSFLGAKKNRTKWAGEFLKYNIDVMFIEDIVEELENHALTLKLSKNEIIQILRLQNIKNAMK